MSDESNDEGRRPLIHSSRPDPRGTANQRIGRLEKQVSGLANDLPKHIATGSLEMGKKLYQELYEDIAKEHGRVFEVQEAAFMAIVEQLHARLAVIEEAHGIASPELHTLRETLEAIGEYFGAVADGDALPWSELSPADKQVIIFNRILDQRERAAAAVKAAT